MKIIYLLLIFCPITLIERYILHTDSTIIFITSCISIIPLAIIIGNATEQISIYIGPKAGGFLNATMGNVPELLISGFAIKAGLYSLVLASLAGSILGNILMVLGISIFVGGLKYKFQNFNQNIMRNNFTLLSFASFGMIIPFFFKFISGDKTSHESMQSFSLTIAIVMLVLYLVGLIFSLFTHKDIFDDENENGEEKEVAKWSKPVAIAVLAGATVFVALMSETLVATVEPAAEHFGLSEAFVGIILIPILGNVAEHASAVIMAYKNKLNISIEIAAGSSMQIALFVLPVMVVLSAIMGNTMELVFTPTELFALVIAIVMAMFVLMDRKTNWLEGFQLFLAYILFAVAFLVFGL